VREEDSYSSGLLFLLEPADDSSWILEQARLCSLAPAAVLASVALPLQPSGSPVHAPAEEGDVFRSHCCSHCCPLRPREGSPVAAAVAGVSLLSSAVAVWHKSQQEEHPIHLLVLFAKDVVSLSPSHSLRESEDHFHSPSYAFYFLTKRVSSALGTRLRHHHFLPRNRGGGK
jgi:hypothetical protein